MVLESPAQAGALAGVKPPNKHEEVGAEEVQRYQPNTTSQYYITPLCLV